MGQNIASHIKLNINGQIFGLKRLKMGDQEFDGPGKEEPGIRLVYVAGSFRAPSEFLQEQNVRAAEEMGLVIDTIPGVFSLVPHTQARFLQGALPDELWAIKFLTQLRRCDAVFVLPHSEESDGTEVEVEEALSLGKPVFTDLESLREWAAVA